MHVDPSSRRPGLFGGPEPLRRLDDYIVVHMNQKNCIHGTANFSYNAEFIRMGGHTLLNTSSSIYGYSLEHYSSLRPGKTWKVRPRILI
jgi:hypothetical protein